MKIKMKSKSHRTDINRYRSSRGVNVVNIVNIVNIKCLSMMMLICIKQHLSNIWSWIHEKVKQHWGWIQKKPLLISKKTYMSSAINIDKPVKYNREALSFLSDNQIK